MKQTGDEPIPIRHLKRYAAVYPRAWKLADAARAMKGKGVDWPAWCFLPVSAALHIAEEEGARQGLDLRAVVPDVGNLAALIAWRQTQGIYRIDPDVYPALWETPIEGDLPTEILFRLPEWCVWIETPADKEFPGFFAYLEADANDGRAELRIALSHGAGLFTQPIHLTGRNLVECLAASLAEGAKQAALIGEPIEGAADQARRWGDMLARIIGPRVNLVLYLCAVNSDIRDTRTGFKRPANPEPIPTRRGPRLFPAATPTAWDVGVRMGAAIRAATEKERGEDRGGSHASPRPHIRRAHWHTFRHGPGRRESALKWLPPIPVNVGDDADLPAVIRDVK